MKHAGQIIVSPRITEKAAYLAEQGCYVFNIATSATKGEVRAAVKSAYKVTPRMVRVSTVRGKARMTRGTNRMGMSAGGKKAYVYLKKGDTIDLA